ncbi:ABC transporter permease subunit [Bacillus pacificus]
MYALLPILRNTYTGIRELDESLIEAAKAMGMNSWRRLWKVELPLAFTNYYGRYSYGNGINCWNGYISSTYRCWWAR